MKRLFSTFQDTIYSLSTGWGKSAIAVIRVSGPSARIAAEIAKPRHLRANLNLKPRYAYFKTLYGIENQVVD
jgi:tRNA U34 5-carboxymethylaminomethyl modifying GTPase MnmE/TrmE